MTILMILSNKDISVFHMKKYHYPSDLMLEISLMDFKRQQCGIFEGLEHPK